LLYKDLQRLKSAGAGFVIFFTNFLICIQLMTYVNYPLAKRLRELIRG